MKYWYVWFRRKLFFHQKIMYLFMGDTLFQAIGFLTNFLVCVCVYF